MDIRFGFFTTLALILNNKLTLGHVKRLSLAGSLIITSGSAHALLTNYDLSFETSGQSMWEAGTAFRKQESAFLGTQWTNKNGFLRGYRWRCVIYTKPLVCCVGHLPFPMRRCPLQNNFGWYTQWRWAKRSQFRQGGPGVWLYDWQWFGGLHR